MGKPAKKPEKFVNVEHLVYQTDVLFTVDTLARRWSIHPNTLYKWFSVGKGPPGTKLADGILRFTVRDVLEFEQLRTHKPMKPGAK